MIQLTPYYSLIIVLAIIVITPFLCKKLYIPDIVGYIIMGIIIGPYCLNCLDQNSTTDTLGKLGMLYIMFQVGIDLDKNVFHFYKKSAFLFGFFSFLLPFVLGCSSTYFFLEFPFPSACLLGATLGSHTLMTYPILTRFKLQRLNVVNILVGGTIVATTLSLLVLAIVKDQFLYGSLQTIKLIISIAAFTIIVLVIVPKIMHFILKRNANIETNFVVIMIVLVLSAFLAEKASLDAILGSYACGLALNGLLPQRSSLMNQLHFLGNTILVPLFLISVGLIINPTTFISGKIVIGIAVIMILIKLTGKGAAALIIKLALNLNRNETILLWAMTQSASAGTIAIITTGFHFGIFDESILNAGVIMICVLCTGSSFLTQRYSEKIYKITNNTPALNSLQLDNRWLLITPNQRFKQQTQELVQLCQIHESHILKCDTWEDITRQLQNLNANTLIYQCLQPLNTLKRIVAVIPKNMEKETHFGQCMEIIRNLSGQIATPVIFYTNPITENAIKQIFQINNRYLRSKFVEMDDWEDMLLIVKKYQINDLIILFSSQPQQPSYNPLFADLPNILKTFFDKLNVFVIYPNIGVSLNDIESNPILHNSRQSQKSFITRLAHETIDNLINKWQHGR